MPISSTVLAKYLNPTFVETGTYAGDCCKMARDLGFEAIYTVDLDPNRAVSGEPYGAKCYAGNSPEVLQRILPTITGNITFWLDAHPSGLLSLFDGKTPVANELLAIYKYANTGSHVILIDDMRLFSPEEQDILEYMVRRLWGWAVVSREDGIEKGDILCVQLRK